MTHDEWGKEVLSVIGNERTTITTSWLYRGISVAPTILYLSVCYFGQEPVIMWITRTLTSVFKKDYISSSQRFAVEDFAESEEEALSFDIKLPSAESSSAAPVIVASAKFRGWMDVTWALLANELEAGSARGATRRHRKEILIPVLEIYRLFQSLMCHDTADHRKMAQARMSLKCRSQNR